MDIVPFLMDLAQSTWNISTVTVPYLVILLSATGVYMGSTSSFGKLLNTLSASVSDMVIRRQKEIVYSLIGGGLVMMMVPGKEYIAYIFIAGMFLHTVSKLLNMEIDFEKGKTKLKTAIFLSVILVSLAALAVPESFLNTLPVLYLFAIIFIRL